MEAVLLWRVLTDGVVCDPSPDRSLALPADQLAHAKCHPLLHPVYSGLHAPALCYQPPAGHQLAAVVQCMACGGSHLGRYHIEHLHQLLRTALAAV